MPTPTTSVYCASTDVELYFTSTTFGETGAITKTKVDSLISQRSVYIDSAIGRKYALPLTDATDLLIIKNICARLVAGEIDEIQSFVVMNVEQKKGRDLKKEALADIQKILDGEIALKTPLSSVEGFDGAPEEETTESEVI